MVNVAKTLKNLNEQFPRFQLETLLKIVSCINETSEHETMHEFRMPKVSGKYYVNDNGKVSEGTIKSDEDGLIFEPKKHHLKDKTSSNVNILTKEEKVDDEEINNVDDEYVKTFMSILKHF